MERPIQTLTKTEIRMITKYLGHIIDAFGYERMEA